jgi:MscS family membrane protein
LLNVQTLQDVLSETRKMLREDARVEPESARIRFVKFGASSLDLEVFAYVFAHDYAVFLGIQEELWLRVMTIIEASGTGVAFPSQATYLARNARLDADKTEAARVMLGQWKGK